MKEEGKQRSQSVAEDFKAEEEHTEVEHSEQTWGGDSCSVQAPEGSSALLCSQVPNLTFS